MIPKRGEFNVISVVFEERDDGGLRVYSDDVPGFELSHPNRDLVLSDVQPALETIIGEMIGQRVRVEPVDESPAFSWGEPRWIADFTYVWTAEGWLYVAAVIDLFSRRVVGWSMKAEMTAQLVTDALIMAIWRRGKPDALLHHSDQGSQYASEQFQKLMADNRVACSMSRSGNVWDNAAMESFFSSLKTERIRGKVYRTRDEARADVFDYIERFYNAVRRHSTIGYVSPVEFERKAGLA
jgi:putative transposase